MKKLLPFFSLLFIMCCPESIWALDSKFYSTITLSISELGEERVQLYPSHGPYEIVGEYTQDILRNLTIGDLTTNEFETRIYNKYERIAVRPLSKIDIGYYWFNNTAEGIDIETIRIPMTRQVSGRGDLPDIVYDIGFQTVKTCTSSICKGGKSLDVDGVGIVSPQSVDTLSTGVVLDTLTVKLPIEITEYQIEYMNEYTSKIIFKVKNNVNEYLTNVLINYTGSVDIPIDLEAYQEITVTVYKQCDLVGEEVHCGSMRIKDPNTKTHCMIYGSPWSGYNNPDSITVFNKISDEWISGSRVQPDRESFCIQRLPYIYITEDMIGYIEIEEPEITDEEYWRNLLNIDVLPITSYRFNMFDKFLGLIKPNIVDNLKVL